MALNDIDTIVVVIMENRSFDHMLGYLSLPGAGRLSVEGLSDDPAWLAAHANLYDGAVFPSHRLDPAVQVLEDPTHSWGPIGDQVSRPAQGGGPMGGFVYSYAEETAPRPADLTHVMGYYDAAAVPTYDFFARNFAVCDHWFAALPASTQPNKLMAMAGEAPLPDNQSLFLKDQYLVYDWLNDHKVRWCAYQSGGFFPFLSLNPRLLPEIIVSLTASAALGLHGRFRRLSRFHDEWNSTAVMPSVIFIEPEYGDGPHRNPNDDHPPTGVANGQALLADIYATLISNPARWAKTMMIVTYDEHGGFYDHVPPIPIPSMAGTHAFATTGLRVPAFVISPQVAPGTVFNRPLDHTSILQLLDDRFAPAEGYSVAVNARQGHLDRIANVLQPMPASPRAPAIPEAALAPARASAAAAPVAPPLGASPSDPANAQAMHQVILKAADEHPELLSDPAWQDVKDYIEGLY